MFSGGAIKSLGKRFRDGNYGDADVAMLEEYRATFEPLLLSVSECLNQALTGAGVAFVVAGRSKRIKSIIRKLARPGNRSMDLSRMADIVGLRVIVRNTQDQDPTIAAVASVFTDAKVIDYRSAGQPYRSVHILVRGGDDYRAIEIQIRTLPQQLWANESESFGEEVKAGGGDPDVHAYLLELSALCANIETGSVRSEKDGVSKLLHGRLPLSLRLPLLRRLFEYAAVPQTADAPTESFIVVYDTESNQCYQKHRYAPSERLEAMRDYRRLTHSLDEARYEILVLNSSSDAALQVTHPRFFPEPQF